MKLFESDRNNRIFSEVANKLLTECFLIKKRETDDYLFVIQNREKFSDFFGTIGYEVNIYEHNGVVQLVNIDGNGRIRLKKDDSVMILLLRLLYIEKKKSLSENTEVRVTWRSLRTNTPCSKFCKSQGSTKCGGTRSCVCSKNTSLRRYTRRRGLMRRKSRFIRQSYLHCRIARSISFIRKRKVCWGI